MIIEIEETGPEREKRNLLIEKLKAHKGSQLGTPDPTDMRVVMDSVEITHEKAHDLYLNGVDDSFAGVLDLDQTECRLLEMELRDYFED